MTMFKGLTYEASPVEMLKKAWKENNEIAIECFNNGDEKGFEGMQNVLIEIEYAIQNTFRLTDENGNTHYGIK